jgi:hypothetical protein
LRRESNGWRTSERAFKLRRRAIACAVGGLIVADACVVAAESDNSALSNLFDRHMKCRGGFER